MKVNLITKLISKLLNEASTLSALGSALNRNLNNASLADITNSLQKEINNNLVALVSGKTVRIQALRDMAKLEPDFRTPINAELKYCFPLGVNQPSYDEVRIVKLELLALAALTDNTLPGDFRRAVSRGQYPFEAIDTCDLMQRLGEENYIRLECQANIATGGITVTHLHCPSEDMDVHLTAEHRAYDITFARAALFNDCLGPKFDQLYPDFDLDLGDYYPLFAERMLQLDESMDGRIIDVFYGCQKNADVCVKRRYEMRMFYTDGVANDPVLMELGSYVGENRIIAKSEVLPFMVAALAVTLPEENKFWIHYDPDEKAVCIQVGDPNEPAVDPVV